MPETTPFRNELLDSHCIIDVRTPLEFAEDHLPGAVNVPILSDQERVEIGTIHKHEGPQRARQRGLELTCARFGAMVSEIAGHADGRPILVYCWRGGLRSCSMAVLLDMSGYEVLQLKGGYKAFRAHVAGYFEDFKPPQPLIVIHGMTGSGKTTFINGLDRSRWGVIDLEGLACHRGSAFGALGLKQDITQKRFETILWDSFRTMPPGLPIVLEGESQRIGRITLPGRLYEVMGQSCKVWCQVLLETRVARLAEEYARPEYRHEMGQALERIRRKLDGPVYESLRSGLTEWDVPKVARELIEHYYDRLYYKHRRWIPDVELDLEDFAAGERQLYQFWQERATVR